MYEDAVSTIETLEKENLELRTQLAEYTKKWDELIAMLKRGFIMWSIEVGEELHNYLHGTEGDNEE
jgi:hypothetical protein